MTIITRAEKGSALTHAEHDNNFVELDKIPNGKVFPKEANVGIKLDVDDPAFGWHDLTGSLEVYGELGDASREPFIGGLKSLQFDVSESAYVDFHIPHDYVPGTSLYIHVHWSHASATVTGGTCTWAFEIIYAKGHNRGAFQAPVTASVVQNASTIPYQHMIAETIATVAGGSGTAMATEDVEVDGLIGCRLYLDSNDIVDSVTQPKPFAHFVDIHYQSSGIATKNRSPNFYGA